MSTPAKVLNRCLRCGRREDRPVGTLDYMTLLDGAQCGGIFVADASDASLRRLALALLDKLDGMGKAMLAHDSDLDRFWSLGFNAAKHELAESAEYTALREALEG